MKCSRCGKPVTNMNHFFVPSKDRNGGKRYCIACAREEKIITLA